RNVISGNGTNGIEVRGLATTVVQGNYIGTDAAGAVALGNGTGILLNGSSASPVGGTASGARNVISGNRGDGVQIVAPPPQPAGAAAPPPNVVQGNFVGTNAAGAAALGNGGSGIVVGFAGSSIGGAAAGAGNVISA